MAGWVGPALVAAVIAALVSVAGWFVTARQTLALERGRRAEKMRDFQIALRAEIRSELADIEAYDLDEEFAKVVARYESDPDYSIFLPNAARHSIFDVIVAEIYILPEHVIEPVVFYIRQREVIDGVRSDIRAPAFRVLAKKTQMEIYRDYLNLRIHLRILAERAVLALGQPE